MAFAHRTNRVTIEGTMYGGSEIWSTGFWAGAAGGDAPNPTAAGALMVANAWEVFFESAGNLISHQWATTKVKITPYDTTGVIDEADIVTYAYPAAIVGPDASGGHPPQCAVVASLIAGNGIGVGGKGRMYIPGVAGNLTSGGKMASTTPISIADKLSTFFSTVNGAVDSVGFAINASHGTPVVGGYAPINRALTTVKVGDVWDTQRRRRNALAEVYATDTIT